MKVLEQAMNWGKEKYPNASENHHAAFANSVQYLVDGVSGGYGGPSIREHAVSWSLAGDGSNISMQTNLGALTVQFPDGRLPMAGEWEFEKACEFAAPICFGQLPAIATRIYQEEYCFDDDPADIEEIKSRGK